MSRTRQGTQGGGARDKADSGSDHGSLEPCTPHALRGGPACTVLGPGLFRCFSDVHVPMSHLGSLLKWSV